MSCSYRAGIRQLSLISGLPDELLLQAVEMGRVRAKPPLTLTPLASVLLPEEDHDHAALARNALVRGLVMIAIQPSPRPPMIQRVFPRLTALIHLLVCQSEQLPIPMRSDWLKAQIANELRNLPKPAPLPDVLPKRTSQLVPALIAARLLGVELPHHLIPPWNQLDLPHHLAQMVVARLCVPDSRLLSPSQAGHLLAAGLWDDHWWEIAEQGTYSLALAMATYPHLCTEQRIQRLLHDPEAAAVMIRAFPNLRNRRDLIQAASQYPSTASDVLLHCHDVSAESLLRTLLYAEPDHLTRIVIARPDLHDHDTIRALVTQRVPLMRDLMIHAPDRIDASWLRSSSIYPEALALAMVARPELRTDERVHRLRDHPRAMAFLLEAFPDLRTDANHIACAAQTPASAAHVVETCPDLRNHPVLWERIVQQPQRVVSLLRRAPELRGNPWLLRAIRSNSAILMAILNTAGPYPELWNAMTSDERQTWARQHRLPKRIRTWLDQLNQHIDPATHGWTSTDADIANRHYATRSLTTLIPLAAARSHSTSTC